MGLLNRRAVKKLIRKSGFKCGNSFPDSLEHRMILAISQAMALATKAKRKTVYPTDLVMRQFNYDKWEKILEAVYDRIKSQG